MKYSRKTVKEFKGRLVQLSFIPKIKKATQTHHLVGEITANTSDHILFKVNKTRPEIPLNYSQIVDIKPPEKV